MNSDWRNQVIADRRQHEHERNGMTVQQLERLGAQMSARLADELKDVQVRVRLPLHVVLPLLETGRLLTIHETGSTGGKNAPDQRRAIEELIFNIPANAPAEARPVYGYLATKDGVESPDPELSQYGNVIAILRPDIRARTTWTSGDSLIARQHGNIPVFAPSTLDEPHWTSFPTLDDSDPDFLSIARRTWHWEAQIHGGVHLEDISEILIPDDAPEAIRLAVKAAGLQTRSLTHTNQDL